MYLNDTNEFILFWVYRITVLFIVTHCFYQLECLVGSGPVNLQKPVYHNDTNEFILFWVYRITVLFIVTHCFYQLEC